MHDARRHLRPLPALRGGVRARRRRGRRVRVPGLRAHRLDRRHRDAKRRPPPSRQLGAAAPVMTIATPPQLAVAPGLAWLANDAAATPAPAPSDAVRCLDCGAVYARPSSSISLRKESGCPACGYVGWIAVAPPLTKQASRDRSDADRRRHRSGRSR